MVDKELIEIWRNTLKSPISSWLLKTNYEGRGEQDKEEFERDFDEILDLALIGMKHKAQLLQERTEERTESHARDLISRQDAIDALDCISGVEEALRSLPSVQPTQDDEVTFWKKRAREYEDMITDLVAEQAKGQRLDSIEITGESIIFKKSQSERKTGTWIPQDFNKSDGMKTTAVYYFPKCSVCGYTASPTNYCPHCGADMRSNKNVK